MLTPTETTDKPKRKYNKKSKTEPTPLTPPTPVEYAGATTESFAEPRNGMGFLRKVFLPLKPNGLIDWRKLISKEHFTLNKMNLAQKGMSTDSLSKDDFAKLVEESPDEDLVIKLAGFREIAEIRGFSILDSELVSFSPESVTVKVTITWLPNAEHSGQYKVSAIANASLFNTDNVYAKFLETIAENRAFIRCVRHSLGILSLGQDEFKLDDVRVEAQNTKIQTLLAQEMEKSGVDLATLKQLFQKGGFEWNDKWLIVEKIDPAAMLSMVPMVKAFLRNPTQE